MPKANQNALESRWRLVGYYAISLCCVLAVAIVMSLRSKPVEQPVEETITVQPNTNTIIPLTAPAVGNGLPVADPDIEAAGDHLAEAVVYLQRRQSEPALNALMQARAATDRAMRRKADTRVKDQLLASSAEIDSARELIRRGKIGTATRELEAVNQKLESVSY